MTRRPPETPQELADEYRENGAQCRYRASQLRAQKLLDQAAYCSVQAQTWELAERGMRLMLERWQRRHLSSVK